MTTTKAKKAKKLKTIDDVNQTKFIIKKNTLLRTIEKLGVVCERKGHCCNRGSGYLIEEDFEKISKFLKIDKEKLKKKYLETVELFNKKLFRPRIKKIIKKTKNKLEFPYGHCIFYDKKKKSCKINQIKPFGCRILNCSKYYFDINTWFLLNYVINPNDPEAIRQYNSYLKLGGRILEGGELESLVPNKEKLRKILSYEIM